MRIRHVVGLLLVCGCKDEPAPRGPPPPTPISGSLRAAPPAPPAPPTPTPTGFDGVVLGADGGPTAAQLTLRLAAREPLTLSADEAGRFSIPDLPEGEAHVELRAPGQVPTRTAVYLPQHGYRLQMSPGTALSLTARIQLHRQNAEGLDGPDEGPLLERGRVDVWWQPEPGKAFEKVNSVEVRNHRAEVRVGKGFGYLEVWAEGRCGGLAIAPKEDGALEIALDGEQVDGQLRVQPGDRDPGPGWTVKMTPRFPSSSTCLTRTAKVSADGDFSFSTVDFEHDYRLEVTPPKGAPRAVEGDARGGRSVFVDWTPRGAALAKPRPEPPGE